MPVSKGLTYDFFSSLCSGDFPSEAELIESMDTAVSVLESESSLYRPAADDGTPGGLLDFTGSDVPVIVVPDLHGRYKFLLDLLSSDSSVIRFVPSGMNVLEALGEGLLKIVCLGDGIHSETDDASERWKKCYEEWEHGNFCGSAMCDEMHRNVSTMGIVVELKKAFPENFHFLKGNHENIMNEFGNGNYPFRKFSLEGEITRSFMQYMFGDAVLHLIDCFEKTLPLCAVFKNFALSHAEPVSAFTRSEIINCRKNSSVIEGLTWTPNGSALEGSVVSTFESVNPGAETSGSVWIGGHRPVRGKFSLRQNGSYVQIHNPYEMNVALCSPQNKFNPQEDIVSV